MNTLSMKVHLLSALAVIVIFASGAASAQTNLRPFQQTADENLVLLMQGKYDVGFPRYSGHFR